MDSSNTINICTILKPLNTNDEDAITTIKSFSLTKTIHEIIVDSLTKSDSICPFFSMLMNEDNNTISTNDINTKLVHEVYDSIIDVGNIRIKKEDFDKPLCIFIDKHKHEHNNLLIYNQSNDISTLFIHVQFQ